MPVMLRPWGHIHFSDQGPKNAPAVVFANALGTDLRMWGSVADALPGHRRIGFDKRGHGLSATPATGWTVEDLADDVAVLMDHLGLARAVIAGCSVGGMVAMATAIRHSARCTALVLSNTAARIGSDDIWQARIGAVEIGGLGGLADTIIERWFSTDFRQSAEALAWRAMLLRCDPLGYIGTCRALAGADLRDAVTRLALPVLMLAGSEDQSTPPALVRETAALIPGALVVVMEGSGHIPAIDAPGATARLIGDFLKGLADG